MLDTLRRDLSFTARTLRRTPTFSITVAAILALGIGMSSAMFTVYRAVLLERMPVIQQDRLVELSGVASGAATEVPILPDELRRFRGETRTLTGVAGFAHWRVFDDSFFDGERQLSLREAVVTDNFFNVLGAKPVLGRLFHAGDAVPWAGSVGGGVQVVLSYGTWQRDFAGDSSVLGKHLSSPKMNWAITIVGVAPAGLDYPRGADFWLASDYGGMDVVGRLAPTATPGAARAEFQAFLEHERSLTHAVAISSLSAQVHTFTDMVSGGARPALVALTAAVALLLILACANVGNLLLLRAAGRVREMAIRRAIGASAADLVRQLLTESLLLALAGGVLGALLGRALLDGLVRLAPAGLPRVDMIAQAGTPVIIVVLVTGATVLLFGIVPALAAVRFDPSSPLRSDIRSGTEGRRLRNVRQTLVASQIALAVVVLAGAGLLLKSLDRLTTLDMGYSTEHLLMLNFSLPWQQHIVDCKPQDGARTAADTSAWQHCLDETNYAGHERVMTSLRAVSGVVAVSPVVVPPFLGPTVWMGRYAAREQSDAESESVALDGVGPEFFRAMGVPIIQGRAFTDADRGDAPQVAIVTEGVAKRLWPNESAIGKQLRPGDTHSPDSLVTVVGVVRDFHYKLHREATPTILRPYRQLAAQGYLVVRTRGAALASDALRRAVEDAGGGATFVRAQSMDDLIAPQLAAPRFDALLLSIFSLAAIVLAAVGLYGIMASTVAQRERELGIRMALGATPGGVRNMVMGQALVVAGVGTLVGLGAALVGARMLTSLLFDVTATDPATLGGVAVLLLVVAAGAAYMPARHATSIDPARALRAE